MNQAEALAIMKTGANVFLTGNPGSGKTYLVNQYIEYLRSHGVKPAITASTGIAATHIGGRTIHSWSGIGIRNELTGRDISGIARNHAVARRIEANVPLIIDEISMLDARVLGMVDRVLKKLRGNYLPFGGRQVIFTGDFFQLPPVSRAGEPQSRFAFEAENWFDASPQVLYLTEQHRQSDEQFSRILAAIRADDFQEGHHRDLLSRLVEGDQAAPGATRLYSHNRNVDALNERELSRLKGSEHVFKMSGSGKPKLVEGLKKNCLSPERLALKAGAVVMFTRNDFEAGYVNGTLGKVVGFDDESGWPEVRTRAGKLVVAEPMDWSIEEDEEIVATITQVPLRLAWAITIHKSQGMSMDAAVMDLSRVFEFGQGYVALSRVRSLEGLHLLGLNERAWMVHPEVIGRDRRFIGDSEDNRQRLADMEAAELQEKSRAFIEACGGDVPEESAAAAD